MRWTILLLLPIVLLAGCGGSTASVAGGDRVAPTPEPVAGVKAARPEGLVPLGDVDGDAVPDVALAHHGGRLRLLLSAGPRRLVALAHPSTVGGLLPPHGSVFPLGDVDGDGRADLAVAADTAELVVLHGRRSWPAQIDLRRPGGDAGRIVGTVRTGAPDVIARDGDALLVAGWCERRCRPDRAYRVPVPRRGGTASLAGGEIVPAPSVARGERLGGAHGPWGSGSTAIRAWLLVQSGAPAPMRPLVQGAGRTTWTLGDRTQVQALTARAALVVTSRGAPNEASEEQVVLHRLDDGGRTTAIRLTDLIDPFDYRTGGTLADAGRCMIAATWMAGAPGTNVASVLAVDLGRQAVVTRWSVPWAWMVTAQLAGDDVTFVGVDWAGTITRARAPLPGACR